jgi:DNA-binding transcriptional ArsR family regulator
VPKTSPVPALVDRRLVKAVSNPTRVDILKMLDEEGPSSPSKIARRLDHVSVNLVSHHIKVLRELGCVERVDVVKHGGRTERIYRAIKRHFFSSSEWEAMEPGDSNPITLDILRLISEDVEAALLADSFDQIRDRHLSRTPLRVDREGWAEVVQILLRSY